MKKKSENTEGLLDSKGNNDEIKCRIERVRN